MILYKYPLGIFVRMHFGSLVAVHIFASVLVLAVGS